MKAKRQPKRPEDINGALGVAKEPVSQFVARRLNRVTDTCIPEMDAMCRIETAVFEEWIVADHAGERLPYFRQHAENPVDQQPTQWWTAKNSRTWIAFTGPNRALQCSRGARPPCCANVGSKSTLGN